MSTYLVDISDSTDTLPFVKRYRASHTRVPNRMRSCAMAGMVHASLGGDCSDYSIERSPQMLQPRSRSAAHVMALILVALALVAGLLPLQAGPVLAQDDTAEA